MPPKPRDLAASRELRDALQADIAAGRLTLGQAVRRMREISGLTQAAFARHRGLSLPTLNSIENDTGNPTVATLDKIGEIFGLRVGYVRK
jgi:DNA-binding XRE family transcriptional regulator